MIEMQTNYGTIRLQLDFDKAPSTSRNFQDYVESGFYDGTIFHRVIDGFMIQGGGFLPGMKQKAGNPPIKNEADNGLSNRAGTIAMARTSDPHSASNQFFINVGNNGFLDHRDKSTQGWGYTVFGRVTEGMDVVDKIKQCKTGRAQGHQDVPLEDVVIERVVVVATDQ